MSAVCGSFALGCGTSTCGRGVSARGGAVFTFSGIGIFAGCGLSMFSGSLW